MIQNEPGRRRIQFRLRDLLLGVSIIGLGLALYIERSQPDAKVTSIGARDASDARLWIVTRGEVHGRFAFAVFEGGPRTKAGLKSAVTTTHNANGDNRRTVQLTRPDGTTLKFPGTIRLVEIIDGNYKETCEDLPLEILDAFVAARPEAFTIDELLKFVAAGHLPD